MEKLIYSALMSLDGYTEDEHGDFGWAAPSEEVHAFVNELERPVGTYLYGRRMYETMAGWETGTFGSSAATREFADIWRAADKVVYSRSLDRVSTERTRLERSFDPDAVRRLKAEADRDLSIGGPDLAAQAFAAGLVDECQLLLSPVIVGGGKRGLPGGVRLKLELAEERRFEGGTVFLRHRVVG
jgi:dihydrofolate reductase